MGKATSIHALLTVLSHFTDDGILSLRINDSKGTCHRIPTWTSICGREDGTVALFAPTQTTGTYSARRSSIPRTWIPPAGRRAEDFCAAPDSWENPSSHDWQRTNLRFGIVSTCSMQDTFGYCT